MYKDDSITFTWYCTVAFVCLLGVFTVALFHPSTYSAAICLFASALYYFGYYRPLRKFIEKMVAIFNK